MAGYLAFSGKKIIVSGKKIIVVNSLLAQKVALLYVRLAERKGQRLWILPSQPSTGD